MTIEQSLTGALFRQNQAGQTVVHPNGVTGRGYVVPDAATAQRLRRALMWMVIAAGGSGGLMAVGMLHLFGQPFTWSGEAWMVVIVATAVLAAAHRLYAAHLVRGLTPAGERLGLMEALKRQAEALPRWYLMLLAGFSPLMVLGAMYWIVAGPASARVLGGVGVLLFGSTTAQSIYALTLRRDRQVR